MPSKQKMLAVSGLLSGAVVWGAIWYPYRLLENAGIPGAQSSLLTYSISLLLGLALLPAILGKLRDGGWVLLWIGLSAGWTNLSYVLAVIHGEVMRVLLLFYLSPFWTVIFAYLLLREKPSAAGFGVMALSLGGAIVMLWHPELGWPLPENRAEWLGLSSGLMFALSNVLARKAKHLDIRLKSLGVWSGAVALSLLPVLWNPTSFHPLVALAPQAWLLLVATGAIIFGVTMAVQYGLARIPSNQAIVILLFELVVAAISSYYLAGEVMTAREWLGGLMIVAATLFSGELENDGDANS